MVWSALDPVPPLFRDAPAWWACLRIEYYSGKMRTLSSREKPVAKGG